MVTAPLSPARPPASSMASDPGPAARSSRRCGPRSGWPRRYGTRIRWCCGTAATTSRPRPRARRGTPRDLRRRPADVRQLGVARDVRADQVGLVRQLQRRRRAEQVGQQVVHHVVEHDRDDHLVRPGPRLEVADQPAQHRAAGEPAAPGRRSRG